MALPLRVLPAYTFSFLSILSAAPFLGYPFPTRSSADYYSRKNEWISELSGARLTPTQAGYLGAAMRIALGLALLYPSTRRSACGVMGTIVAAGTVLAIRDGKPLTPQFGMLSAIGVVAWLA